MTQAARDRTRVRFGVFEVDFVSGELRKRGIKIPLQAQPLQILRMLLERPGEVVTRQELRERLWPADTFVDFEHSLNSSVKKLRQALGDSSDSPRFVETLARRGYRFIASTDDLPVEGNGETASFPLVAIRVEEAPVGIPKADDDRTAPHPRRALLIVGGIAAAAALLAAAAIGGWWFRSRGGETRAPSFHRITFRRGTVVSARFAPDGKTVAYGAAWDGATDEVFTVRTDDVQSHAIGLSRADLLGVSSKGELAVLIKKVNVWGMGTLARIPIGGGTPREVLEDIQAADWAPNGEDFAVARRLPNGKAQLEYPIGNPLYEAAGFTFLRVSPKGDLVAFVDWGGTFGNRATITTIDRNRKRKALSAGWAGVWGLAWSPPGDEVVFTAGRAVNDVAIRAVSLSGRERVLLASNGGQLAVHDFAPDGRLLVERTAVRNSIACLPRGESRERDIGWLDGSSVRGISEDGSLVLFTELGDASDPKGGVFLRKTDGTPAIRLGDGNAQGFSSDGRWVLSRLSGPPRELVLLPTGPGPARKVLVEGMEPQSAYVLPNATGFLVFANKRKDDPLALFMLGPDGGKPKPVRAEGVAWDRRGVVSPDGDRFIYVDKEGRLKIAPLDGGSPTTVPGAPLGHNEQPAQWSADGRYLYLVRDEIPAPVDRLELATGRREPWKKLMPEDPAGITDISPVFIARDGRSYAYSYYRVIASDLYVVEMPK